MATEKKVRSALLLRLDAASTPERVAIAASMFADALRAAGRDLPPDSVTMVVDNWEMTAGLRPRTVAARAAVATIATVAENPLKAVQKRAETGLVAEVFAEYARELAPFKATLFRSRQSKPIAVFDDAFAKVMAGAARAMHESPQTVRGTSVVYSKIYRAGRLSDDAKEAARISVDGRPVDVRLEPELAARCFDALKGERVVRVHLYSEWIRPADGVLVYNPKRTRIVALDTDFDPLTGGEFIDRARALVPSLANADVDAIMNELRGD